MQLALTEREAYDLRIAVTGAVNDPGLYVAYLKAMRSLTADVGDIETIDKHVAAGGQVDMQQKMLLARRLLCFHPHYGIFKDPWAAAARLYRGLVDLDKTVHGG